jgi:cyclopropane fatty-acyl-phospholipid synthase-like methyltransferase
MMRRLFFDLRYRLGHPPWDTGLSPPELLSVLVELPRGHALDLGCGTGTNVVTLSQHGWQVVGVDFSPKAIALARRRLRSLSLAAELVVGDVTRLHGIAGPFDLALDIGCYHSLGAEGQARYVEALASRLRPGSCFLLYTFLRESPDGAATWPTEDALRRAFASHFVLQSMARGTNRGRSSAWVRWQRRN